MDPFSALTGSISLFNTCLHAYRIVAAAIEVGTDSLTWDVLMRIERSRFEIWGRSLGFLDETTGAEKTPDEKGQYPFTGLADIMVMETVRDTVVDTFKSISRVLKEFEEAAEKYALRPTVVPSETSGNMPDDQGGSERKREKLKRLWGTTRHFSKHFWLVLKDDELVENLLGQLSRLNDGLDKLYTASQRSQSIKALSTGVLREYDEADQLAAVLRVLNKAPPATIHGVLPTEKLNWPIDVPRYQILAATAQVKKMCIETSFKTSADMNLRSEASTHGEEHGIPNCYKIPGDRVRVHRTPITTRAQHLWPIGTATCCTNDSSEPLEVLVEWRDPYPRSAGSDIHNDELERRRDLIVRLLHDTSSLVGASGYRLLNCIGYIQYEGRVDGEPNDVIGFLSRLPSWADTSACPITLHKLLSDSFEAETPGTVPSLNTRLTIAKSVSNALYQLQCSQWLHRSLTSYSIIFFIDKKTGLPKLDQPYLTGLQYSRPDDQPNTNSKDKGKHNFSEIVMPWGNQALYLHPDYSTKTRRYRRSDDIYSLGVILVEIAFWEPVRVFMDDSIMEQSDKVINCSKKILNCVETEMSAEVGNIYRDATIRCLTGLQTATEDNGKYRRHRSSDSGDNQINYDGTYSGEDPEVGLEEDLLWKVIREIEKCNV